jgi:hypothetical protein
MTNGRKDVKNDRNPWGPVSTGCCPNKRLKVGLKPVIK